MSSKTSAQPGRRTPLSLSGAVTKSNPNKSGHNAATGSGNNANGHNSSSSSNKQDNKMQQQKNDQVISNNSDIKENSNKRQQLMTDKKQQQQSDNKKSTEKGQNGVNNNKQQQSNDNKQQQQSKEKTQQQNKEKPQNQNGNDENKINEKNKKEKSDQQKSEKEDTKLKEDEEQHKPENKKEEKNKEVKDAKENTKEGTNKNDSKAEQEMEPINDGDKMKEENPPKTPRKKQEEKIEDMEVVECQSIIQNSIPTPTTPKSNNKTNKVLTPVNKTPTNLNDKTPPKSTPTQTVKTTPIKKREETTAIDDNDIEMEPLSVDRSPIKLSDSENVANIKVCPSATSTPGKIQLAKRYSGVPKSDVQLAMQTTHSLERPKVFSQISGRKSIRPISDYTPSKFQSNLQFRESYRRINTELDVSNCSMNVTVGSEAPNNSSFLFFGRGRKRDRTSQHSQSAMGEFQNDADTSPPKRARRDMYGILGIVSSPISLLRNRFSKASLQSSTPLKVEQELNTAEEEVDVQNVSGESVHEIATCDKEPVDTSTTINDDNDVTLGEEVRETKSKSEDRDLKDTLCERTSDLEQSHEMPKNKRCNIM